MVSPVAGLTIAWPSLPEPCTHSPPMNISRRLTAVAMPLIHPPVFALRSLAATLRISPMGEWPGPRSKELQKERDRYLPRGMGSTMPVFAASGSGAMLTDVDGYTYIDFATGISVMNVGYRRPAGMSAESLGGSCVEAVRQLFKTTVPADRVAGILVEPVQGEGGFVVPPPDFLPGLRAVCGEHEIPLIIDEVQTGFGRTGTMFAIEQFGIEPDLIVLAKSLGGGLPLAAVVGRSELMDATNPGGLGGTFGGNPVACAAALAVIDVLIEEKLPQQGKRLGDRALNRMRGWQERHPQVGDVRGLGAMVAMELVSDRATREPAGALTNDVLRYCHQHGLVLLKAGLYDNVIRLLFPLVISEQELDRGLDILEAALVSVNA